METCEHEECTSERGKRSPYCDTHKAAHRREWNKLRMRQRREGEKADAVLGVSQYSSGRSMPSGPDVRQAPTQYAASRRFSRKNADPDVVDYTQPGATDRASVMSGQRVQQQQQLQRYRAPAMVDENAWTPGDTDYYQGAYFGPRNDMSQGPYSQGNMGASGFPMAFQVVKVSR